VAGIIGPVSTLSEINVYPVKACRGIALESSIVRASGLEWDRRWMFVDARRTFLTQRTHPQLARITTRIARDTLDLGAPGLPVLSLPLAEEGTPIETRVWQDGLTALDQGDRAAEWAREAIGEPARIVRAARLTERHANRAYTGATHAPMGFADGYPVLVCNRESLTELNRRMPEPIPIGRFRPNLVIDGLEPFAEDHIDTLVIGPVTLRLVKPCTRCIVTSTDQETGERSTNPLPVLRGFRWDRELRGVTFGENAVVESGNGETLDRGTACTIAHVR
jgi:uncharacterized protein